MSCNKMCLYAISIVVNSRVTHVKCSSIIPFVVNLKYYDILSTIPCTHFSGLMREELL